MTLVRVKGFKIFKDRHGKPRCYHRQTGLSIDLVEHPLGSASFLAECSQIAVKAAATKKPKPKAGTLGGLIATYFSEFHFRELSDASKREYRMCANLLEPIADYRVENLDTPTVASIHDRIAEKYSWDKANRVRNFLIQVFKFCVPKGLIDANYAENVIKKPRPKGARTVNRPWTFEEVQTVLDAANPHLRVALAAIMCTGQDPTDVLEIKLDQIADGVIWGSRNKTRQGSAVPITEVLAAELRRAPPHQAETLLANSKGQPWTYDGFATGFQRLKKKLESAGAIKNGLTPKGLRHTMATWLREAGLDERDISDLLAQKSKVMGLHYSKDAALIRKNTKTIKVWESEYERRRKLSNQSK